MFIRSEFDILICRLPHSYNAVQLPAPRKNYFIMEMVLDNRIRRVKTETASADIRPLFSGNRSRSLNRSRCWSYCFAGVAFSC